MFPKISNLAKDVRRFTNIIQDISIIHCNRLCNRDPDRLEVPCMWIVCSLSLQSYVNILTFFVQKSSSSLVIFKIKDIIICSICNLHLLLI